MKRTELKELWASSTAMEGKEVLVCGWIRTSRDSKNFRLYRAQRRELL